MNDFDDVYRGRRVLVTGHTGLRILTLGRPDVRIQVPMPALRAGRADPPHDPSESESRPADDPAIPYRWAPAESGASS